MRAYPLALLCAALLVGHPARVEAQQFAFGRRPARFAMGLNVAAPFVYGGLAAAYETALVPVAVETSFRVNDYLGVAASVHYGYLTSDAMYFEVQEEYGTVRFRADDVHHVFVGIGPRLSLSGRGLEGWYLFVELAFAYSHASGERLWQSLFSIEDPWGGEQTAYRIDLGLRPEVGYAISFGRPGLFLSMGLGARVLFTAHCDPPPAEDHETSTSDLLIMYTPIVNLTLGFDV